MLGTLLIDAVDIQFSGDEERPVLIVLKINGNSKNWRKYNWFQIQERVKKKVESSGFGYLFKLKVRFDDGKSFSYDFSPSHRGNCLNQVFPSIFKGDSD